jgi:polyphosphate kinase
MHLCNEMQQQHVFLVDEKHLDKDQQEYVRQYFIDRVRSNIIPLLIEDLPALPYLREKSIFLGVVMSNASQSYTQKFALIEVPSRVLGRFVQLPDKDENKYIILLEDVIRFNLPYIFSYFNYERYDAHIFKITKDAEIDMDTDLSTTFVQKIEKGLKNRRKGKPTRFVYDKEMNSSLLEYLIQRLHLTRRDNIIPGGRIHNFRHFMNFPDVFPSHGKKMVQPFTHPALQNRTRVTEVVLEQDIMLYFPYHTFNTITDMLREAAIEPDVISIKITAYRLAEHSTIVNALINAARNGKQVTVVLELRARFNEEANLEWKERLEDEGVKVLVGLPNLKVHAKICVIKRRDHKHIKEYGFVSTGNLNEQTSNVYIDFCLLTANRNVMADVNRIFRYLENPKTDAPLRACKTLMVAPTTIRQQLTHLVDKEIKQAKAKKKAVITLKLNSLSDEKLIVKLYEAAQAGVKLNLIIRGIYSAKFESTKKGNVTAISIVDQFLEHARVYSFRNGGKEKTYISSADWMVRNLDHRVEAAVPITDPEILQELKENIDIQLSDNVKARILDDNLSNHYVPVAPGDKKIRSQIEIYKYLLQKATAHKAVPAQVIPKQQTTGYKLQEKAESSEQKAHSAT